VGNKWTTPADLGRAQIYLLRHPDIKERQKLQGMIYLATNDWQAFLDSYPSPQNLDDAEALNNSGANFLALSEKDPMYLLKAIDLFVRATERAPQAPEPLFNLAISYRKLRLGKAAEEALH